MIWAGIGLVCLTAGVLALSGLGVALYPKFTQWNSGSEMTVSADTYASFLGVYKAFFFGIFPAIAFLSAVLAWTVFKNLKCVARERETAS